MAVIDGMLQEVEQEADEAPRTRAGSRKSTASAATSKGADENPFA